MRGLVSSLAALAAVAASPPAAAAPLRLFHDSFSAAYRSPQGAVPAGTRVTLRVRATGAKSTRATLRVYTTNPLTDRTTVRDYPMRRAGSLWSVTFRTPATPSLLGYVFRVRAGRTTRWYGDDSAGPDDDVHQGGRGETSSLEQQRYQLTVYDPSFTTPSWLQGAFVYEIFVDRFRDGGVGNDYCRPGSGVGCPVFYGGVQATGHATWNERLEDPRAPGGQFNRDFFGGDLAGIQQKLDYLKALGVDAIWLTPIFAARSNHRYDTDDYLQIDPALGGDAAFAALAGAASASGIRLILDGVFNHTSSDSRYFDRFHRYPEVGACESASSPYRAWYHFTSTAAPCRGSDYASFFNLDTLPQLNHENAAVRDFMYRGPNSVVRHWAERGAAGWRLDAADQVPHDWWRDFRSTVRSYAPEAPLIGEVWPDASAYLLGNEFDSVMNYRFRRALIGFARTEDFGDSQATLPVLDAAQFASALAAVREDYPPQATAAMLNLVDSHDTSRLFYELTQTGETTLDLAFQRMRVTSIVQFTYPGAPLVYYGDEAAIDAPSFGAPDPYNRAPYPWLDAGGDPSVYGPPSADAIAWYSRLATIRHEQPALRAGGIATLLARGNVYAYVRTGAAAKPVLVAVNKGGSEAAVTLRAPGYASGAVLTDLLSGPSWTVSSSGTVAVRVPARNGVVLAGP